MTASWHGEQGRRAIYACWLPLASASVPRSAGVSLTSAAGSLPNKHVYKVVLTAHSTGLALMVALALILGEQMPSTQSMLWGMAAGTAGTVGLAALYRGLAVGKMGIV